MRDQLTAILIAVGASGVLILALAAVTLMVSRWMDRVFNSGTSPDNPWEN